MKALRIKDWSKHYENNRTRELKSMEWVPVPNKMDGYGYSALVTSPQGAAGLGCWLAIVEIASRMKVRGTLVRDGQPLTIHDISMMSRIPEDTFEAVIPVLIERCKWLEEIEIGESLQYVVTIPQDDAGRCLRAREEGNGMEGKGREGERHPSPPPRRAPVPCPDCSEPQANDGDPASLPVSDGQMRDAITERGWEEFSSAYPSKTGVDAACRWWISECARCTDIPALRAYVANVLDGLARHLGPPACAKWADRETGELQPQFVPPMDVWLGARPPNARSHIAAPAWKDHPPAWKPPRGRSNLMAAVDAGIALSRWSEENGA